MADTSVHITSSDLPEWATEATLDKLAKAVEALAGLSAEQKREMKSGFKDMKETGKATRENMKKAKTSASNNIFGDVTSGLKSFGKELNESGVSLDSLQEPLDKFNKGLGESAKRFGIIGGAFAVFGQQVGLAISDIKDTVGALRDMTDTGIYVRGGFEGLRDEMAATGMTLSEVQEISGKYARTVGNVGLRSILDLTKSVEDNSFKFREYGLLIADGAEFQAKMLESQRLGGIFEARDKRANSLALQENIKNLTAYSKILNVSREDMAQAQIDTKSRADVQRRLNSMDEESRKAANASFDQFSAIIASLGPEAKGLGDMMTTIIADPAAVNSEAFTQLAAASPEAANAILELRDKVLAGEEISQQDIVNRLLGPLDAAAKSGQLEMLSMNDAIGDLVNQLGGPVLNSLRNYNQRLQEEMEKGNLSQEEAMEKLKNEGVDPAVTAAMGLDQEFRRLSTSIQSSRINKFMDLFGEQAVAGVEGMTNVVSKMADAADWVGDATWTEIGAKVIENLVEYVIKPIGDAAVAVWDYIKMKFSEYMDMFMLALKDIPVRFTNAIAASPLGEFVGMEVRALPSQAAAEERQRIATGPTGADYASGKALAEANLADARARNDERMIQLMEAQLVWIEQQASETKKIRQKQGKGDDIM